MSPTELKAIIVREGIEAALVLVYELVVKMVDELNVQRPPETPIEPSPPVTTKEEA